MDVRKDFFLNVGDDFMIYHAVDYNESATKFSFHMHSTPEIIYIVKAKGYYVIEEKRYSLKENDIIVAPTALYHEIILEEGRYERYVIRFDPTILNDVVIDADKLLKKSMVINCADIMVLRDIFLKTDYYSKYLPKEAFEHILPMLIKEMIYNISICEDIKKPTSDFINPILAQAIDYINRNLFEIKSVSEISKELNISSSYLLKIFTSRLKISPKKYLLSKRMHAAKSEIILGNKPTDIYERMGFNDYATFYKNYINFFGHPPSKEREINSIACEMTGDENLIFRI